MITKPLTKLLGLKFADRVLNPDGSLRKQGNHIYHGPARFATPAGEKMFIQPTPGTALAGAGASPYTQTYTPTLPTDIGAVTRIDPATKLWSRPGNVLDGQQFNRSNCWMQAVIQGMISLDLFALCSRVYKVADGRYRVVLRSWNGSNIAVEVNDQFGDTWTAAGVASTGTIGSALIAKAYAFLRTLESTPAPVNTLASLDWGSPNEMTWRLGLDTAMVSTSDSGFPIAAAAAITARKPVFVTTPAIITGGAPLIGSHVYSLVSVNVSHGLFTLRNPWGYDGVGVDDNTWDGLVTVDQYQLSVNSYGFATVTTAINSVPLPSDLNADGVTDAFDVNILSSNWQKMWTSLFGVDAQMDAFKLNEIAAHWQQEQPGL